VEVAVKLLRLLALGLALMASLTLIGVGGLGIIYVLTKYPEVVKDLLILVVSVGLVALGAYVMAIVLEEV
jgi:hypothetical protein